MDKAQEKSLIFEESSAFPQLYEKEIPYIKCPGSYMAY